MKNLLRIFFLFTTISLQAMQDIRIEPFEYAQYGSAALAIFNKTLQHRYPNPPSCLYGKKKKHEEVHVILRYENQNGIPRPTVLGFSIFGLATMWWISTSVLQNRSYMSIDYLCVDPDHQTKGYGRKLMEHIEQRACEQKCNYISLIAEVELVDFYKRLKYQSIPDSDEMRKGLQ